MKRMRGKMIRMMTVMMNSVEVSTKKLLKELLSYKENLAVM